ncbi:TRAP transporter substrate-binding protein [Rhodobacteraceae bacterium RKSG542]|nr:TRAP transporter substrate-binding protein [Pseudovibrio flavus]
MFAMPATAVERATLRLAHNLDPSHTLAQTFDKFADDVKELSGGKMKIRIYPSGQMGETREVLEMMQQGAMDMTKGFAGELESFEPSYFVFNVPYLFNNDQHLKDVIYGDVGADLDKLTAGKGFFNLASYAGGTRSIYTNKPIRTPEDMAGLKIRVMPTPTTNAMIELMGGAPAPIPWGETYTAIQQGVIDGAENNEPSYISSRHFEVSKYFSEDQHTVVVDYLVFATKTWEGLSEEQRAILIQAAENSEKFQQELWDKQVVEARAMAKEAGTEFVEVDKAAFRAAVQPLIDDLMKDENKRQWIERIQAAGK